VQRFSDRNRQRAMEPMVRGTRLRRHPRRPTATPGHGVIISLPCGTRPDPACSRSVRGGEWRQVIAADWLTTRSGARPTAPGPSGTATAAGSRLPGGAHYRNCWWVTDPGLPNVIAPASSAVRLCTAPSGLVSSCQAAPPPSAPRWPGQVASVTADRVLAQPRYERLSSRRVRGSSQRPFSRRPARHASIAAAPVTPSGSPGRCRPRARPGRRAPPPR